jgi:hypothetical protein
MKLMHARAPGAMWRERLKTRAKQKAIDGRRTGDEEMKHVERTLKLELYSRTLKLSTCTEQGSKKPCTQEAVQPQTIPKHTSLKANRAALSKRRKVAAMFPTYLLQQIMYIQAIVLE